MRMNPLMYVGNAWAGMASAVICYVEYLGLGAVLGPALLGYGDQSKAVGTLLVLLSACIASLIFGLRRASLLAGPRGASLSVLVLVLLWLQVHFSVTAQQQLAILTCVLLGSSAMLWMAAWPRIQQLFDSLPQWLVPSFLYASAVGIVASAVGKYLFNCLQIAAWQTWAIYLSSTLLGVLWPWGCRKLALLCQSLSPELGRRLLALQGLSLILAAGWAWLGYWLGGLYLSKGGRCARLGSVELDLNAWNERFQVLLQGENWSHGWQVLACAVFGGVIVGAVIVIESRTAVQSLREEAPFGQNLDQAIPLASNALHTTGWTHLPLVAATSVPVSISQARTQLLWSLGGHSHIGVLFHAAALLGIAVIASPWLAWLPQLSLAVLMTLIAIQMVGLSVVKIWSKAYDPQVAPALGLRAGLGLWLVLGIAALSGQVILAFVLPAIAYGVLQLFRVRCVQRKKSERQSE